MDDVGREGFVEIARFGSELEAEAVGHALDQYDIPFIVKSDNVLFGQGSASAALQGVTLWVPRDRAEEVAMLLSCVAKLPAQEEGEGV